MGYAVYDNNGWVDLLGSATAFKMFGDWARTKGGELEFLGEHGYSEHSDILLVELKANKCDEPFGESTRKRLIKLAPKCFEHLIVSDS